MARSLAVFGLLSSLWNISMLLRWGQCFQPWLPSFITTIRAGLIPLYCVLWFGRCCIFALLIKLLIQHIPRRLNVIVDSLSWNLYPANTGFHLNSRVFCHLCHMWDHLQVNLFASNLNWQLPTFVSSSASMCLSIFVRYEFSRLHSFLQFYRKRRLTCVSVSDCPHLVLSILVSLSAPTVLQRHAWWLCVSPLKVSLSTSLLHSRIPINESTNFSSRLFLFLMCRHIISIPLSS